jgi:hypothetical protein
MFYDYVILTEGKDLVASSGIEILHLRFRMTCSQRPLFLTTEGKDLIASSRIEILPSSVGHLCCTVRCKQNDMLTETLRPARRRTAPLGGLFGQLGLVGFPARAPGGVPAPQPGQQGIGFLLGSLAQAAVLTT